MNKKWYCFTNKTLPPFKNFSCVHYAPNICSLGQKMNCVQMLLFSLIPNLYSRDQSIICIICIIYRSEGESKEDS